MDVICTGHSPTSIATKKSPQEAAGRSPTTMLLKRMGMGTRPSVCPKTRLRLRPRRPLCQKHRQTLRYLVHSPVHIRQQVSTLQMVLCTSACTLSSPVIRNRNLCRL